MKKLIIPAALLLSSAAMAKIEMSGYMTPAFKMGADSASEGYTNTIYVDDAAVAFEGQVNDHLTGTFVLWASQDVLEQADLYSLVDEAYLTHKMGDAYIKGGLSYLPFANTSTMFLSDASTYTFGTMQRTMVETGYTSNGMSAKAFAYNRPVWAVEEGDKAGINSYGASVGYEHEMFSFGAGYVSNMADRMAAMNEVGNGFLKKIVGAYSVNGKVNFKGISFLASYMSALDNYKADDIELSANNKTVKPYALNLELGYTYPVMGKDVTVGVGYQKQEGSVNRYDESTDPMTLEGTYLLPQTIMLAGANIAMDDNSTVKVEYRQAKDEKAAKGGETDGHTASKFSLAYNINF